MKDYREIWEEICFILSEKISANVSESVFEQKVIMVLEKLGWSQFKEELQTQKSLPIGRQSTIRPDIILYGPNRKALVAIEIKKPAERLGTIEQLKSYMRQIKADFGLLIGSEIRFYYDGAQSIYPEPLQLEKIFFERSSRLGQSFVEIFTKSNFLDEQYLPYLKKKIGQFNRSSEINKLKKDICSRNTENKILKFLKSEYAEKGQDIVDEVINGLKINLSFDNSIPTPPKIKPFRAKPIVERESQYVVVCKNKGSGKLFIYLNDYGDGSKYVLNQEGKTIPYDPKLYEKSEERKRNKLLEDRLLKEGQVKKYDQITEMKKKMGNLKINRPTINGKTPSPSPLEWSSNIPELSKSNFKTWKSICDFLNLNVGTDSARRVLKKWVKKNKTLWPEVPELDFDYQNNL